MSAWVAKSVLGLSPDRVHQVKTRFETKFVRDDATGCWMWTAAKANGYGRFYIAGWTGSIQANRVAHELYIGPIPAGFEVDHLCRRPSCVNPSHLEAVTPEENRRREYENYPYIERCARGHIKRGYASHTRHPSKRYCPTCRMYWHRANRAGMSLPEYMAVHPELEVSA